MLIEDNLYSHSPAPTQSTWLTGLTAIIVVSILVAARLWIHEPRCIFVGTGLGFFLATRSVARGHTSRLWRVTAFAVIGVSAFVAAGHAHHVLSFFLSVIAFTVVVGPVPPPPPANRAERHHVWSLVNRTVADTLAPFALRTDKSYVHSPDGRTAVAYRVRWGTAVVSGDPVGDAASREAAIDAFCTHAAAQGWRIAALGVGPKSLEMWRARGLWTMSIGREVILDVEHFTLIGSSFRNLRQSVQHTHNSGVSTEIIAEADLSPPLRRELQDLLRQTPKGLNPRGFVMILDRPLRGEHPGTLIALARSRDGKIVACQRYASADGGRELTLDIPWRLDNAPNGIDERLIVDMIGWARGRGGLRVSLSFAPFPDLFGARQRTRTQQLAYWAAHRLDRFIQLESLYRFLHKFRAFADHRYVALRPRELVFAAAAILSLEFGPSPQQDRPLQ